MNGHIAHKASLLVGASSGRTSGSGGFHWADAGLGAVGALALVLVAVGAIVITRELRRSRELSTRDRTPSTGRK